MAADRGAQRTSDLAEQVAEEALRCELLIHLALLQLLKLLLLDLLLEHLLLGLLNRIGPKRQERAADAAGSLPDLVAKALVAEQAANSAPDQAAERCAQQAAEETLRRELLLIAICTITNVLKFIHDTLSLLLLLRRAVVQVSVRPSRGILFLVKPAGLPTGTGPIHYAERLRRCGPVRNELTQGARNQYACGPQFPATRGCRSERPTYW